MNEFGYTSWGMSVLRIAEPTSANKPDPLLPRARSIARNGGVTTAVDGREARATVHRGSEASVVTIEFAPLTRELAVVLGELGITPDTITDDHFAALSAAGVAPGLVLAGSDCSCRARSERCLHLLATLYDVTRRIDETPALALTLQGFGLGDTRTDTPDEAPPRWLPLSDIDPHRFYE